MNVALDLGTHVCRSLRGKSAPLVARRCRSMAALLIDGDLQRSWLERMRIPFIPCDGHLALPGDHAEQLVALFSVPCRDLLADGKVPYADPVARQLIALLVDALLPQAEGDGDICCFTHPGYRQTLGQPDRDLDRRLEFVSRLIRLRGYEPQPLNPAVALALAEMEPEQYTGIGLCLGASGCDVALIHRGNPAVALRLARGGRSVDEALARRAGLSCQDLFRERVIDVEEARRRKETVSLAETSGDDEQFVAEQYRELVGDLADGLERLIAANPLLTRFAQPLTVVLGGGPTRIEGFDDLFRDEVRRRPSLETLGTLRREQSGEFAVARGCLIHATLDARSRSTRERKSA